jgi:septal ring factor EnvC (AmiA/AmiB activator)
MDGRTGTDQTDDTPRYTTSKQVQAWFLGRSRDRWKQKALRLRKDLKRLKQRVADLEASRADWRGKAEAGRQELERLRGQEAGPRARPDRPAEDAPPKKRTTSPP